MLMERNFRKKKSRKRKNFLRRVLFKDDSANDVLA